MENPIYKWMMTRGSPYDLGKLHMNMYLSSGSYIVTVNSEKNIYSAAIQAQDVGRHISNPYKDRKVKPHYTFRLSLAFGFMDYVDSIVWIHFLEYKQYIYIYIYI